MAKNKGKGKGSTTPPKPTDTVPQPAAAAPQPSGKNAPAVEVAPNPAASGPKEGTVSKATPTSSSSSGRNAPASSTKGDVTVSFTVQGFKTYPGQEIKVTGNVPQLGNWNPSQALPLRWASDDSWQGFIVGTDFPRTLEYKYVVMGPQGDMIWYSGENLVVDTILGAGEREVSVLDSWR